MAKQFGVRKHIFKKNKEGILTDHNCKDYPFRGTYKEAWALMASKRRKWARTVNDMIEDGCPPDEIGEDHLFDIFEEEVP